LALVLLVLVACGTEAPASEDPSDDPSSGDHDGGTGGFATGDDDDDDKPVDECAESTKDVYVITEAGELYSFHPPTLAFKLVGTIDCPTDGATPTSMAIDRKGTAWIRHSDGSIWKVGTSDLSCRGTEYAAPADTAPFYRFGMGFSSSTKGGSNEQLFLSDSSTNSGLARLDISTMKLSFVGSYNGALANKTAELTGTGDGKLYGFFVTTPAQVAEISKSNGDIVSTKELPGVVAGNGWAFSFYAGDFYIYTSSAAGDGSSDVTRYRPKDGSVKVVRSKIGFKIVGAGVSTCAPTEGPR
jgi:hypothetical protein